MKKYLFVMCLAFCANSYADDVGVVELQASHITDNTRGTESIFNIVESKNTTIITQEKIQEKKYENVEAILREAPGVIVQNTAFGPRIDMRGSGEKSLSRVKVMVDGISINPTEESMASLPINSIPVESIKKIEIIPGGGATLYGSGTVGGVINISTNSNATKNNFFMDLNYGSFDDRDLGFAGGYNVTKDLYVNYGFNYSNSEGYRENEEKENKIFLGGFDYKINDKHKIRYQGRRGNEKDNGTNEVSKKILEKNRKAPGLNLDVVTKSESNVFDYEYRATDKLLFGASFFNQKQERDISTESIDDIIIELSARKYSDVRAYYNFYDVKSLMNAKFKEEKNGVKLKTKYEYDKGELILGYDYTKANIKRDSKVISEILKTYYNEYGMYVALSPSDRKAVTNKVKINLTKESHGIYAFNKYNLTNKLDLTTGIRGEYTEYTGNRVNGPNEMPLINPKIQTIETDRKMENYAGELGLLYKYRDTGNFYTRYERGFITPFPSQLTDKIHDKKLYSDKNVGFFIPPNVNVASIYVDNHLKAETTNTVELGFRDYIYDSYASLTFFITDTDNEIVLIQSGVTNPAIKRWQYKNIGKTRRLGLEAEAEQYFGKFTFSESLTLIDAKTLKGNEKAQIKKGDTVPLVPKAKLTLGTKYSLTDNLSLNGTYTYISSKEGREMTEEDKSFSYKIDGYGVLDIGITYKLDEYSSIRAGIKNLASTKYNLRETSIEAVPAPERNYYIGLNVKF
ncbi:TonB-dependent receptor [Cetobacterium sp.]|uniref:TonB-dependent receptor n=1 Tax=Cetobacterium sp. TaxID=2071632 RepID=UPI003AF04CEF